jgi:iron-sulfur cluster assembly accessory protein
LLSIATSPVQIGRQQSPITLTDIATGKIADLLADEPGSESLALRVAVKPGGCSGYSYDMFFDTEIASDDLVWTSGAVKVVVDPESAELIKGATLDYNDGLQGAGFHITNPNATKTCGCGSSFS